MLVRKLNTVIKISTGNIYKVKQLQGKLNEGFCLQLFGKTKEKKRQMET